MKTYYDKKTGAAIFEYTRLAVETAENKTDVRIDLCAKWYVQAGHGLVDEEGKVIPFDKLTPGQRLRVVGNHLERVLNDTVRAMILYTNRKAADAASEKEDHEN